LPGCFPRSDPSIFADGNPATRSAGNAGRRQGLRSITPQVLPNELSVRDPEERELLLSGLPLAAGQTE
jgi:hypothetical protein